jgi:hypothetical protein
MARTKCAFCSADAVEKGGEHVWDNWLNKALPETRYRARKQYSLGAQVIEYDTDSLNEKLPVVCGDCNSGWMSELTLKVKDRFARAMLDGEPFSLGARDAAILAAFTFMKAVVTNHLTVHEYEPFFTRAAREKFRHSLEVPSLTKMWFAAFHGESMMSTRSNFNIASTSTPGPLYGIEFGSFTYVVGKLALQLLAPRWKRIDHRGRPLVSLNPGASWDPAVTRFWPHDGTFLSWPPSKYLGDDMIQEFILRFPKNPVNVPIS